jgi:hypothetical protein
VRVVHFFMERKQLVEIARRAEGRRNLRDTNARAASVLGKLP